jgi:signal transduction histidine kinase
MILKVSQVDIVAFTRDIYDNFKPFAQHNGVNLSFNQTVQPSDVWVDPHRIDSVIFNILSNALKFTPRGKSVDVSIDQDTKANEVLIKVADGERGSTKKIFLCYLPDIQFFQANRFMKIVQGLV